MVEFVKADLPQDAYELTIDKDKISIRSGSYGGFLYGIESLIQLLPDEIESNTVNTGITWLVPKIEIKDQPRFQWRGLMLDLSRHFFGKEYIKKTIDRLAMHKMNVLHLHLVDDQGWRIEIKKYPKLTEVGAWRVDQEDQAWNARLITKPGEKATYGGFLTQEDLKEIVAYAQSRNVEVVPEIEMPAHVMSAIAAYPELSCSGTSVGVPSGGVWPVDEIYCAGKENTFEFLENVLLEVMEIFPSEYIHIGGDEATKTNWKKCPHCRARMRSEKLKNVEELQSYFIKRMEKFINAHGKRLIGWDEILEGGLAPEATVMSWRGVKGGLEAAEQGHDVVMTPGTHCYFDHYQGPQNEEPLAIGGYLPLNKVYQFDPVVDTMTPEEAKFVLGGQANLWSEYISTESHSEYMIFPRLAALAETVWSPKELRNWDDFSERIKKMMHRYDLMGINYAKSAYLVTATSKVDLENKSVSISLQNEFPCSDIRYVLEDKDLNKDATKYTGPIEINRTTVIKASLFEENKPVGNIFTDTIRFHKAVAGKVNYLTPYSKNYKGSGESTLVNTLRGTRNFHDGQWQAWIGKDMKVVIDLGKEEEVSRITVGSMESQGPGIYFPQKFEVYLSNDGKSFKKAGELKRAYAKNNKSELKDFIIPVPKQKARYVKVITQNRKKAPNGSGVWTFVDEILVE
jgi:hexosaminidase